MIYDQLQNIGRYRGISVAMDAAIGLMQRLGDLSALPDGPLPMEAAGVQGAVTTVQHQKAGLFWEAHQKHVDIQISLTGGETISYWPAAQVEGWGPWQEDLCLSASAIEGVSLPMEKGRFAVFFPWDAHRPNEGEGSGRKLVLKVAHRSTGPGGEEEA